MFSFCPFFSVLSWSLLLWVYAGNGGVVRLRRVDTLPMMYTFAVGHVIQLQRFFLPLFLLLLISSSVSFVTGFPFLSPFYNLTC